MGDAIQAARELGKIIVCIHCPYNDICDNEEEPLCYQPLAERAYPWKDDVREGYYRNRTHPPIYY